MICLGLSGRVIEKSPDEYLMPTPEFIAYAGEIGFKAVELRAGQVNENTGDDQLQAIKKALDNSGVKCHFINCRVPQTDETKPILRRHVELAAVLGCDLIQVRAERIRWLQEMCDFAADFGVRLFSQVHTGGIMETVAGAVCFANNVERNNYGLGYEPLNLMVAREDYGIQSLKAMGRLLFMAKCQSMKHTDDPNAEDVWEFKGQRLVRCLPDDPDTVNYPQVFSALKAVGYEGPVTIIDPICTFMDNDEFIRYYYKTLSPLC